MRFELTLSEWKAGTSAFGLWLEFISSSVIERGHRYYWKSIYLYSFRSSMILFLKSFIPCQLIQTLISIFIVFNIIMVKIQWCVEISTNRYFSERWRCLWYNFKQSTEPWVHPLKLFVFLTINAHDIAIVTYEYNRNKRIQVDFCEIFYVIFLQCPQILP